MIQHRLVMITSLFCTEKEGGCYICTALRCSEYSQMQGLIPPVYGPDYTKPSNTAANAGRMIHGCGQTRPGSMLTLQKLFSRTLL